MWMLRRKNRRLCEQPWISNYINAKKKGFGFSI
jgi:hypothetical protein